jgi:hypothetical protein
MGFPWRDAGEAVQNRVSNRQRMSRSSCNLVHSDRIQLARCISGGGATLLPTGIGDRGRASRFGMSSSPLFATGARSPGAEGIPTLRPTLAVLWN